MTTRTVPKSFPLLRERDYFTYRIARAPLIKNLAHAQNYLWAKAYRLYSTMAYEGNGNRHAVGEATTDAAPDGTQAVCVASFLCPPNWGASQRVKVQGRGVMSFGAGTFTASIWVGVYELDGTSASVYVKPANVTVAGTADWVVTVAVPGDRDVQIRVFILFQQTSGASVSPNNRYELKCISARYETGNATELGGDAPFINWKALSHDAAGNDLALSSGLLVDLVRDINGLYASRPPELCQSWLGDAWANTNVFTEVGRYTVWIPPKVTSVAGYLQCFCTHGGAGNEVRILLNGVVVQTFAALLAGNSEQIVTAFAVTPGAEAVITVEARSTAAGANWGTIVHGVWMYEEGVTLGLPVGTAVPASYQPLDEDELLADKPIVADLSGAVRAGIRKLLENNTWLARHRLRWLVGDWRHRVYKRVDSITMGFTGTEADPQWDWTPGPLSPHNTGRPRNITIRGDNATADGGGGVGGNGTDGIGGWPYGYSIAGADFVAGAYQHNFWPSSNDYYRHGRRVGRWRTNAGTGTAAIRSELGARARMLARGRRVRPTLHQTNWTDTRGPVAIEQYFLKQGRFALINVGSEALQIFVTGLNDGLASDLLPLWYGPRGQLYSNLGDVFDCVGRLLPPVLPSWIVGNDRLEGEMFEMELLSACIMDEPLNSTQLAALP